mgnify:CR=1 FL=1
MYSAKDVKIMSDMTNTQFFRVADEQHIEVSDILNTVCKALTEKGYNPINQIVGYQLNYEAVRKKSHKPVERAGKIITI